MSNIQYAYMDRARVPDRATLQAAIDGLGFDLRVPPGYAPFESRGFLPFVLQGEDGPGFEIGFETTRDLMADDPGVEDLAAGRDACISMAWHGSMHDLACVLMVSCALMKACDAVVSYEGEPPEPLENLLATIPEVLVDARAQVARAAERQAQTPAQAQEKKPWWKLW